MARDGIQVTGAAELERSLETLGPKIATRVGRKAVTKSAKPMLKHARANAPRLTGLLRLSLAVVTRTYKRDQTIGAVLGARHEIKGKKAATIRQTGGTKAEKAKPANYHHLVELGTKHSDANPFTESAFEATKRKALTIMADELRRGIDTEAKRSS